jgi:bifunctional non-homologous end joining protein LigD
MRSASRPVVAGVPISHAERVVYPDLGITKLDVAHFYEAIGGWILPHVRGRPLTLVHCPNGLSTPCRYMRHSKVWGPDALRRVKIQERTKIGEYLVADSLQAVIGLAQMGVLEIHTWNSTTREIEKPNRIVWDLDPGPSVAWADVVMAARRLRSVLQVLALECWVKTTGGNGLHVVVPVTPVREWSECLEFSRAVAHALVRDNPTRYTVAFAKRGRERQTLIDYLRNNRTNTSVCAYSTRAREGAPVSMPISWDELGPSLRPARFSIRTAPRRLARIREDPWAGYWTTRQQITNEALAAVSRL